MTRKTTIFRRLPNSGEFIVAPGVYDGYILRLVERPGFKTAATSGAAVSNALLGVADIGIMGLRENVDHCRNLARCVEIPLTAGADNGYGNPVNVHHTVRLFEESGAAGIHIEDQVAPKRCGHMPARTSCRCPRWSRKSRQVIATGVAVDRPDLLAGIEDSMALMDHEGARALDSRLLSTATLVKKYRTAPAERSPK